MSAFQRFGLAVLVIFVVTAGLSAPRQAQAATLTGVVLDTQGKPVDEVAIEVKDTTGKVMGRVTTNPKGEYTLEELPPGEYHLTLNPLNTNFRGQTVVATVEGKGLTVSWTVSSAAPAIAAATPGVAAAGGILGLGTTQTFLGGVGLVGAGVGGAAASGSIGGGGGGAPVSPGQ